MSNQTTPPRRRQVTPRRGLTPLSPADIAAMDIQALDLATRTEFRNLLERKRREKNKAGK